MAAPVSTIDPDALLDLMRSAGFRLTDLAEHASVSMGFLSELCSGKKSRMSPAVAKRIADALGVKISDITKDGAA